MKKVMRQVGSDTPKNTFGLSPKIEEVVAEEVKVEETEAQPIVEAVAVEEHTHDENCDHPAEEQAPKRSRKKQAESSDVE
jgi:hypothetical protein